MKNIAVVCLGICFAGVVCAAADGYESGTDDKRIKLQPGPQLDGASGSSQGRAPALLHALQTTPGPKDRSEQVEMRLLGLITGLEDRVKNVEEQLKTLRTKQQDDVRALQQEKKDPDEKLAKELVALGAEVKILHEQRWCVGCCTIS